MKTLTKSDLLNVLSEICEIASGRDDPYENDGNRLLKIHDLAAQCCGKKEMIPGVWDVTLYKIRKV